jgi:LAO/AO transport system kinase
MREKEDMNTRRIATGMSRGDRASLAKAITLVENDGEAARELLSLLPRKTNASTFVLGITGPPGTGKSTLVDRLIEAYRGKKMKVGVIAVDPSSPLTGGALLGDRIRMSRHSTDSGVFIRSMASRGWSGGLAGSTAQVVQLMEGARFDIVLIETAGIGQSDVEVMGVAHAVIVVMMPGLGDIVQVSKAGLMEIGDIYVVNKSDMEGADAMEINILSLVKSMRSRPPPDVIRTSALRGEGMDRLVDAIEILRKRSLEKGGEMKLKSVKSVLFELAKKNVLEEFSENAGVRGEELARQVIAGKLGLDEAARRLARRPSYRSSRGT